LWWREASRAAASPLSSSSRMFIIRAGEEGEPSWDPAFRMGWWPASSSSIRGRRALTSLAKEANFGYAGPANCGCRAAAACSVPRLGWPRRRLRRCLLPFGWGVAVCPPHGRRSRRAQVRHIHSFSRAGGRTGGSYKTSYAAGAVSAFLDGLVLTPAVRTGARTSLRALGRPPFAGTALVRRWPLSSVGLSTVEVVASAGFNGLVVAPRRKTGARTFSQWRTC
jgi:hypothetical protein